MEAHIDEDRRRQSEEEYEEFLGEMREGRERSF